MVRHSQDINNLLRNATTLWKGSNGIAHSSALYAGVQFCRQCDDPEQIVKSLLPVSR